MQGAHEIRGSAAVAATGFQHPFAAEIHLGRRAVVELDEISVGLVGRRQRHGDRRILLVAVVEEQPVIVAEQASLGGEPVLDE